MDPGIIVSCQPTKATPFDNFGSILAFAVTAEKFGAVGVKVCGVGHLREVKEILRLPVIACTKAKAANNSVEVTPEFADWRSLFEAGADFIATSSLKVVERVDPPLRAGLVFEADVFETAQIASRLGVGFISTTLSGYTAATFERFDPDPDFELLEQLTAKLGTPIIAEGRYSTFEHIHKALSLGAHSICIGSAITRPDYLVNKFVKAFENAAALCHS